MMRDEPLHPDLQRCLYNDRQGTVLEHPLMMRPYQPRFNALYNRQYKDIRAEVALAKKAKDWPKFIFLHEEPFRAFELEEVAAKMSDQDYWRIVADVWLNSENLFQRRRVWIALWSARREHRGQMMRSEEHEVLDSLPEVITIYRGCPDQRTVPGLSWTTGRRLAVWFANRFAIEDQSPLLASAKVSKKHVKALFKDRHENETELVVLPQHLRDLDVETLPLRKRRAA